MESHKHIGRNVMIVWFFVTWISIFLFQHTYYSLYAAVLTIVDASIILEFDGAGI